MNDTELPSFINNDFIALVFNSVISDIYICLYTIDIFYSRDANLNNRRLHFLAHQICSSPQTLRKEYNRKILQFGTTLNEIY